MPLVTFYRKVTINASGAAGKVSCTLPNGMQMVRFVMGLRTQESVQKGLRGLLEEVLD